MMELGFLRWLKVVRVQSANGLILTQQKGVSSNTTKNFVTYSWLGPAIAQKVSRWLPIAVVRVRSKVRSYGICGGQSGTGAGFIQVLRFPLPILILLHTQWIQSQPTSRINEESHGRGVSAPALYVRDLRFQSRPGNLLSSDLMVFLSTSRLLVS
jgi:hypothetical protein